MRFSPAVSLILGAILAVLEALQLQVLHASLPIHDAITLVITVLAGVGVLPATLVTAVPHHLLVLITALIGGLALVQGDFSVSSTAHTIIAVVLVVANTLFSSTPALAPAPAAAQPPPRPAA